MSKLEFFSGPVTDATRCNQRGYTSVSSFPGNRRVPAPDLQLVGCQNLVPAARKASLAIEGRYQTNFTEAEAFLAPGNEAPRPRPRKLKICLTYHVILATSCHDLGL